MSIKVKLTLDIPFEGIEKEIERFRHRMALKFFDRLIANIESNKFGFQNKLSTIRRKKLSGNLANLPLYDTGAYINAITCKGSKVYLDGNTRRGMDFGELGNILEYGRRDRGFVGYPVWRKTFEELQEEFKEDISTFMQQFSKR